MKQLLLMVVLGLVLALPARAQDVLTLREAIDLALEKNYAIQIVQNDIAIASNNYSLGNAGFLPFVGFDASVGRTVANTTQRFLSGDVTERDGALTRRKAAGVGLQWTVFDGFGRNAVYDRLGGLYRQQQTQAENTTELVLTDVIVSYYDIARQQQQLRVLDEAVEISEERMRIAELRRDLGSASELEVRQARLDLNADRAAVLRQRTALVNARADFNQLLVRPLALDYAVVDSIELVLPLDEEVLERESLERNSALALAEQTRYVAQVQLRELRAEWMPTVGVNAGLNYSDLNAETGFLLANETNDFTYGATLSLNLFDGMNRRRRGENALIQLKNAELIIEDVRTRLQSDISRSFQDYQNSLELITIERENLALARLNVDIGLDRFELGTITSIELREVQETLTRAQSLLLLAQFEAKRAETELRRLSGRLID
ncbi:MAG: TolC family protein [Rhodothermales bacterium]|nr:TolC family protein [Rhodothermales bacterium]